MTSESIRDRVSDHLRCLAGRSSWPSRAPATVYSWMAAGQGTGTVRSRFAEATCDEPQQELIADVSIRDTMRSASRPSRRSCSGDKRSIMMERTWAT